MWEHQNQSLLLKPDSYTTHNATGPLGSTSEAVCCDMHGVNEFLIMFHSEPVWNVSVTLTEACACP